MADVEERKKHPYAMAGMIVVALLHAGALALFVPQIPSNAPSLVGDVSQLVRDYPWVVLFGGMLYAGFGFALDRLVPSGMAKYLVVATIAVAGMLLVVLGTLLPLYRMNLPR